MPKQIPGEPYTRITVDEAAELHGTEDNVFVDVRRMDEYVDGHVKDAVFITVDDLLGRVDELPQDKNLLFICAAGVRSGPRLRDGRGDGSRHRPAVQHRRWHSSVDRERLPHQLRDGKLSCPYW